MLKMEGLNYFKLNELDNRAIQAIINEEVEEGTIFRVVLNVDFIGEKIRSEWGLKKRLNPLFPDIYFSGMKVERRGADYYYHVDLDQDNFCGFVDHENIGGFSDYSIEAVGYLAILPNNGTNEESIRTWPVQTQQEEEQDGDPDNLTIILRKGTDEFDSQARGMQGFNLLSETNIILKLMNHFDLTGKVEMVSRGNPGDPTLKVKLKEGQDLTGAWLAGPICLLETSTQTKEALGSFDIYAHLVRKGPQAKRVSIEGSGGRIEDDDLLHILSFQGEVLTPLVREVWAYDGPLAGVQTGTVTCIMKIRHEFNFIMHNSLRLKVNYAGQGVQCSICFGPHRAALCSLRESNWREMADNYYFSWVHKVGFKERTRGLSAKDTPAEILDDFENVYGEDTERQKGEEMSQGGAAAKSDEMKEALTELNDELAKKMPDGKLGNQDDMTVTECKKPEGNEHREQVGMAGELKKQGDKNRVETMEPKERDKKHAEKGEMAEGLSCIEEKKDEPDKANNIDENVDEHGKPTEEKKDEEVNLSGKGKSMVEEYGIDKMSLAEDPEYKKGEVADDPEYNKGEDVPPVLNGMEAEELGDKAELKKRKGSPLKDNAKRTHIEKEEKEVFNQEMKAIMAETKKKPLTMVRKEKLKQDLEQIMERQKAKIFKNPGDSKADARWLEVMKDSEEVRRILNKTQ